jgi:transcriptional regulator
MSMLKVHKKALTDNQSLLHEFLLRYNKAAKRVYGFVEGQEDPSFYRGAIDNYMPVEWDVDLWPAGNKSKVLQLYEEFDWHRFDKKEVMFFVDRDLSDFLNETIPAQINIYVTDKYSIENDIVNRRTCDRVLSEVCKLSSLRKKEKERILDLFDKQLKVFQKKMVPIMSWVIYWKRNGRNPALDNINMKHLFIIERGRVRSISKPKNCISQKEYIHKQCNITCKRGRELKKIVDEFCDGQGKEKFVRGKYILWFFVEFVVSVSTNISYFSRTITTAPKMNISLNQSSAIVLIAPRAFYPKSLRFFLDNTCVSYSKGG